MEQEAHSSLVDCRNSCGCGVQLMCVGVSPKEGQHWSRSLGERREDSVHNIWALTPSPARRLHARTTEQRTAPAAAERAEPEAAEEKQQEEEEP
jgi:hypothetical protein